MYVLLLWEEERGVSLSACVCQCALSTLCAIDSGLLSEITIHWVSGSQSQSQCALGRESLLTMSDCPDATIAN